MFVTYINRGNIIAFTATFLDVDGEVVIPDSAVLHLSYMISDGRTKEALEMDADTAGSWSAEWDSSIAENGRVHWSARSENPPSAEDGFFELEANLANPDPESA